MCFRCRGGARMKSDDADTAQMLLAKALELSKSEEDFAAAKAIGGARERIDSGHSAQQFVLRALDETGDRQRELLKEAMQLLEPHTSRNLEVKP